MNLRNLLDDFNFKIDPMFGKKYYVQKALTLLARGDHRAGGCRHPKLHFRRRAGGEISLPMFDQWGGGRGCQVHGQVGRFAPNHSHLIKIQTPNHIHNKQNKN